MSQPAAPAATIVTTRFLNQFGPPGIPLRSSSKNEAVQMERAASTPTISTVKKCYDAGHNLRLLNRSKAQGRMLAESYGRISVVRN
jgi:hypothetical protein